MKMTSNVGSFIEVILLFALVSTHIGIKYYKCVGFAKSASAGGGCSVFVLRHLISSYFHIGISNSMLVVTLFLANLSCAGTGLCPFSSDCNSRTKSRGTGKTSGRPVRYSDLSFLEQMKSQSQEADDRIGGRSCLCFVF